MRTLLVAAIALALAACGEKTADKKSGPPATLITVTKAKAQPLEIVETTLGTLEAVQDPRIAAEIAGRVARVAARAGEAVKKGQLLAELDPADIAQQHKADRAEIARIEALLAQQERLVTRQNELVQKSFISKNALDDASAQRDALKNQLDGARARAALSANGLARTKIVAPFDGVIEEQIAAQGDYLKVGDPLFRLVSNTRLRAHLPFPEAAAQRLQRGQKVRLASPLLPGKMLEGEIEDIRPTISDTGRAVGAIAGVDNPDGLLKGGGSVDAAVVIGLREAAVMVPEQSVVLRPAGKVVYAIVDGKAEQRVVNTGGKQSGLVEIVSGLKADETVALDGAGFLTNGAPVTVKEQATKPATPATSSSKS
ncbi:MAG: efflux RND transporter periplasmic adaptor subunit [Rhodocyclaceae bacterium]|nr:efflux RND transporter periplasmic adaptor subunit [Rhodocyclaceae bacterium]